MIILDTNVLSEIISDRPAPAVLDWLSHQPDHDIWITVITVFEIQFGLRRIPSGNRQERLEKRYEVFVFEALQARVLSLDKNSATQAAMIRAEREKMGRPGDKADVLIAGIASAYGASIATRNIRHFADTGVMVVDPWAL